MDFVDTYMTKSEIRWLQKQVDAEHGIQIVYFKSKLKNDMGDKYSYGGMWEIPWDGSWFNGQFGAEPTFKTPYGHNDSFDAWY